MAKNKHYSYADSRSSSHGEMRCCKCGKPVTEGRYRYHETNDAYVVAHEACCADDPKWAEFDKHAAERATYIRARSDACRDFRAEWGVNELDEYVIEEPANDH